MSNRKGFTKRQREKYLFDAETGDLIQCSREGCCVPAQHIHHKIAVCNGGSDEPSNLEMLCQEHHIALHKANGDFAKWGEQGGQKTGSTKVSFKNLKQFQGRDGQSRLDAFYGQSMEHSKESV